MLIYYKYDILYLIFAVCVVIHYNLIYLDKLEHERRIRGLILKGHFLTVV